MKKIKLPTLYILAVAVFILVNIVISYLPVKVDLSYGKVNTLSSSTQKIIKKLDDIVNIKFFVSSDLPTRLLPLKNDVIDLLGEYKKENSSKVNIKILDPKKDSSAATEAQNIGIPQLQFSQLEQDKYAVTSSYFGIALSYGNKKEIIPQVTDVESLEYNLTAALYKMMRKELIKIGVVGEDSELSTFKKVLSQQFDVGSSIDSTDKTLLIFDDNKKEYSDQEKAEIKKHLENKDKIIFFIDGIWVADDLTTSPAKHNLFSLLDDYGIKLNSDLVLSTSAELVNFGNSQVSFFVPYPFWMKTNNFNLKSSYFSNISVVTFPWVSSLILANKNGVETKDLIKTSNKSWQQTDSPPAGGFILDPQNIPQPVAKDFKEFIISAYAKKQNGGEIVVIPSSRFVLDRYLSRNSDNVEFVLNLVNDFASGGALSGIRQKAVSFYPLPDVSDNFKDIFKYLNILLLPGLFAIFGGVRLLKRR